MDKDLKRLKIIGGRDSIAVRNWIDQNMEHDGTDSTDRKKMEIIGNERDILNMLQVIIQFSQKDEEIASKIFKEKIKTFQIQNEQFVAFRDRLPNGATSTFVTPYLTDKQIEKITNDVTKEIESKYDDTFDDDELSCYDENNNIISNINNKNSVCNGIEMLEFNGCDIFLQHAQQLFIWDNYLKYSHSRVVNGLPNLKALAFCGYVRDGEDCLLSMVTQAILNSIGNKLTSLHLCDSSDVWTGDWQFCTIVNHEEFDDKCKEKYENITWYLKNVSELCVKIQHDTWYELLDGTAPLINEYTLPNLKHLKIMCFGVTLGDEYLSPMLFADNIDKMNNLQSSWCSLVAKQLQSLDLCFTNCTVEDFSKCAEQESIDSINMEHTNINRIGMYLNRLHCKMSQGMGNININKEFLDVTSNDCNNRNFILKLHFKIDISKYLKPLTSLRNLVDDDTINNILVSLGDELTKLSKWLCDSFDNTMFGFKITFYAYSCQYTKYEWLFAQGVVIGVIIGHIRSLHDIIVHIPFFKSAQVPIKPKSNNNINVNNHKAQRDGLTFQASMKKYLRYSVISFPILAQKSLV